MEFAECVDAAGCELQPLFAGTQDNLEFRLAIAPGGLGIGRLLIG